MAQTLSIETVDGSMGLLDVEPTGPLRGGVVVIQEAFGVTDHIADVCRRFADAGWRAVAPHLYHRSGDPELSYATDMGEVMGYVGQLTGPGLLTDVGAALDHLAGAGIAGAQTATVGYCMGGSVAAFINAERNLGAAATFYGSGVTESRWEGVPPLVELAPRFRAPWFGAFGDQDASIPTEQVEALRSAAAGARVPTELVRYPEAGHAFHCDDRPDKYNAAAAADASARTLAWFDQHVARV